MQPDDQRELARKTAQSIVDHGGIPLATIKETILLKDKVDELLSKEIEFPEQEPYPEMPEFPSEISVSNLPEVQKVEVLNFPEQKAPIVNIEASKAPVVNVSAPIVEMNNEEVVSELKNISGILSKEEVEKTEKVEIVDKDGEEVNFKELFDKLGNKIGNIKTVVGGGGGGLNQDQLRATLLTTQTLNYATQIDDVSTSGVTYIGKAGIGSSASSPVWQIQKIDESGSPISAVITWADGNSNFDNVFSNRTSLTYN